MGEDTAILAELRAVKEGQARIERTFEREVEKLEGVISKVAERQGKLEGDHQNLAGRVTVFAGLIMLFFGGVMTIFWSALQRGP